MRVACPHCRAEYNVDDRRIPAGGLNVKCPKCQKAFPVRKSGQGGAGQASTAVPLPAPEGASARPVAPPPAAPPRAPPPVAPPPAATPPPAAVIAPSPPPAAVIAPPPPGRAAPATTPFPDRFAPPFDPGTSPVEEEAVPLPAPEAGAAAPPGEPLGFGEVSFEEPPPPAPPPPAPPDEEVVGLEAQAEPAPEAEPPPPVEEPAAPPPAAARPPPPAGRPPSGLGPAEEQELEMLFGDAAPAGKAAAAGYRVRRRSGKVFGPFQVAQVVEMLGKGELAGNEEVSPDGEKWSPIGSVPEFGDFIRKLNEAPPTPEPAAPPPPAARPARPAPPRDRMAAPRVVSGEAPGRPRWVLPVAGGALAVLLVAGVGVAGVLTGHGVFFHRLVRPRGGERPGARLLVEARAAFARGDTASLNQALDLAEQALRLDADDARAQAVYAQAAGLLAGRGGAPEAALGRARQLASLAAKEEPKALDSLKAAVAVALAGPADALGPAAAALQASAQKGPLDEDAAVLLAQAAAARGDPAGAAGWLDKAEAARPGAARLAHERGMVALRQAGDAAARDHFARALQKDPNQLSAALELGAIAERAGDLARAEALARILLSPEAKGRAAPAERARAHLVLAAVATRRPGAPEARLEAAARELEAAVQEDPASVPARLELARFLLRRGGAEKAAALLAAAGPAGAADPEVAALQARAMVLSGRALDAQNLVDAALARSPGTAPLLFVKGFIREQVGKGAEAEAIYREASAKAPGDWEPQLGLGRLALRANDLEKAATALKLAAEKGPRQAEVQVGLGDLELARQAAPAAEARYREGLALDPGNARARYGLARVALARRDEKAAVAELERALALDPRLGPALLALASIQWGRGDLAGARKSLEGAVALDPRNAVARARLGAVELESGHADAALTHLEAASGADGSLGEARGWLGRALLARGEGTRAVEELRAAARLEPESVDHHLWLGTALERTGSPAEAEAEYRAAESKDPRRTDGLERLAALRAAQGRCQEGIPELQKALKVAPRQQRFRIGIGDCLEKLGKHSEGIRAYREALKADPKQKSLYYKIARAIHEGSGGRDALAWYERAAREEPQNAMTFYYLGYLYKDRGQRPRAVQAFRAFLKLKPEADERKDVQQEIEDLGG